MERAGTGFKETVPRVPGDNSVTELNGIGKFWQNLLALKGIYYPGGSAAKMLPALFG